MTKKKIQYDLGKECIAIAQEIVRDDNKCGYPIADKRLFCDDPLVPRNWRSPTGTCDCKKMGEKIINRVLDSYAITPYVTRERNKATALPDLHRMKAAQMFDVPYDKVTETQRNEAKRKYYMEAYGGK